MTELEFFRERWATERPLFLKMMKALPEGRLDYRPHEKSRPAGRIAAGMVAEADGLAEIIEKGTLEWTNPPAETVSAAEVVASWEKAARRLSTAVEALDDARWASPGEFRAGGQVVFAGAVRDHCWWILFDLVHHRGQLSTYVRPMGGKVPAVYGPSGDEAMAP
jgi:uncharacterized damage-inducible protein DinB